MIDSPVCPASYSAPQTVDHLVLDCPVTETKGGYNSIIEYNENLKTKKKLG